MKNLRTIPLLHFNDRPEGIAIDTVVIHSMYAPETSDPYCAQHCVELLDALNLSAHFIIDKQGDVILCVDPQKRAWHAGVSKMPYDDDQRENVNNFSIGIELVGRQIEPFTNEQYESLSQVIRDLSCSYPINSIIGHQHIAPERKADPGVQFDWQKLSDLLGGLYRVPLLASS